MGCLYRISFPNGKSYIGITVKTAAERFRGHCYDTTRGLRLSLCRAIKDHGIDAAIVETLAIADDWNYLQELERRAIITFGTRAPQGLNNTDGGDGASPGSAWHKGHRHSAESKQRMSVARQAKKFKHTQDAKDRIGAASKGNKHSFGRVQGTEERAARAVAQTGIGKGASSGHVGVALRKNGKWRAHATVRGRMLHLGDHNTIEAAIQARLEWARSLEERGCQNRCQAIA